MLQKCLLLMLVAAIAVGLTVSRNLRDAPPKSMQTPKPAADQDSRLQAVAESSLAEREGAIVVLDPQTGRVRAVVNPDVAYQNAFPPGSAIKPFTALVALRSNVITPDTRLRCRGKYKRDDVIDACSHPPNLLPFNPAEALAYSCNYYFATVGERLDEERFARALAEFGFGQKTGIDDKEEVAGVLAHGRWQPESAVGEGAFLQVTPIQMATAYSALFNGGRLLTPNHDGIARVRAKIQIDDKHRSLLLEGMHGAVTFGTAEKADLDALPVYIAGKTGTSTQLQGFRSQGWFVGLAFAPNKPPDAANVQLLVVVYLKNAHGSEAAEIARPIFEEFAGAPKKDVTYVSVHQVSENSTQRMPLEDYVLHVVSSEASVEDQPEALRALAIAVRTYALRNLGRHKDEGYDFCSTTHCQRFEATNTPAALADAVKSTTGLVLRNEQNQIIDAYFSASCGGMTANLKTLWEDEAPTYLRGVRDDYCNSGPHYRWTDAIPAARLASALRSDPRTDVGQTVRDISVAHYDQTGRAEVVSIVGDRKRAINGWEFKLIVGRALGWNVLKSSRFNVSRSGSQFVFRGGGFGHGLGLCQEGSHVMAQRGGSFQQILAHYFPGTIVREYQRDRAMRSSSHFRLIYPQTTKPEEAEQVLQLLESTRADLMQRVAAAGIESHFPNLDILFNETTGDFVGRTRMPAWAAAATKNNTIELQPLKTLKQRRVLETTLRHELAHVLIESVGRGQSPRWLAEGMALHLAGEGKLIERYAPESQISAETIERMLATANSSTEMRTAYAAAYKSVRDLIRTEGESKIWKRISERKVMSRTSAEATGRCTRRNSITA
jgi:stage II sporulation protein D (peptidoglycan lytic transglycosylase)